MYDIDMLEGALRHRDKRIRELEDERDALAAHVERLSDAAKRYYNATCGEPMVNIESPFKSKIDEANAAMDALESAIKSAPSASLARLKAQWAQEGARAAAQAIRMDYEGAIHADDIADFVDEIADDYRRQAEEPDE